MPYRNALVAFLLAAMAAVSSFSQTAVPGAATAATLVPLLVRYAGIALRPDGKAALQTSITFQLFKDEQGGDPLWAETQLVTTDATGRYAVHLGAASARGLPEDLFASGEARWLEVQVRGSLAQPRVLLGQRALRHEGGGCSHPGRPARFSVRTGWRETCGGRGATSRYHAANRHRRDNHRWHDRLRASLLRYIHHRRFPAV